MISLSPGSIEDESAAHRLAVGDHGLSRIGVMRLHRDVRGTLGEPVERGLPVIPERWRLPALLLTTAVCIAILVLAIVYGLSRG